MKDITHYFSDLPRKAESAPTAVKEVRDERAKIEEGEIGSTATTTTTTTTNTTTNNNNNVENVNGACRSKRKRGRVKIKISRNSSEGAVCDILSSSTDLVDKTPSPYEKKTKKRQKSSGDSPLANGLLAKPKASEATADRDVAPVSKKRKESETKSENDKSPASQVIPKEFADSFSSVDLQDPKKATKEDGEGASKKRKGKTKQTEKLIELAEKKGYSKRKIREEEEAAKIEKRLEKRMKLFTVSNKDSEVEKSDENTPKNETPNVKKNNLLNYFSKSTPESLEKERQRNAKVTVKAEVHTPSSSPVPMTVPLSDNKAKNSQKRKAKSKEEDADEIVILQSETIVLSPKNEKITSPATNNNSNNNNSDKPKWSLKIQLQSNNGNVSDEEMYTPPLTSKSQKESVKNNEKIPKILLPMKNKKKESRDSPTSNNNKKDSMERAQKTEDATPKTETDGKTSSNSTKETEVISVDDDDCRIIHEDTSKKSGQEKLAPLFQKRKTKPSAEVVAARRLFLQSDIKENSNNGKEKKKPLPTGPLVLPFPKISHVRQLAPGSDNSSETYRFCMKEEKLVRPLYDSSHMKHVSSLGKKERISECLYECVKSDAETVLSEVESFCSGATSLWEAISASTKPAEPAKKVQRGRRKADRKNSKQSSDDSQNESLNSPWTDKYKPKSSAEVVGNEEAVQRLKSWLESWKSLKNNDDYSSSEEFYNSDCSSSSNFDKNQVAVLLGPHGSGKTASVYAVAREFGYKVLEVNASSKRPGKKILKDFEEATKSHRVKKSDVKDMFASVSKKPTEESEKISQNSLILMEDVDLVFDEDEGFVSAAFQLASNTKRPIVMTLTDTCFHLVKMAPHQLRINFEPATGKRMSALMQLIALAETRCKLPQSCLDVLCQSGDLRKGLLQLQYILMSGNERISYHSLAVGNSSWSDMRSLIYKPWIKIDKKKKQQQQTVKDKKTDDSALNNLANNLDDFSLITTLLDIKDPTLSLNNLRSEPSLSFAENTTNYSHLETISLEIGNWLNDSMRKISLSESKKSSNQSGTKGCPMSTKRQIIIGVDSALSQIASSTLNRRALAADYLPSIRTICRAEEIRQQLNSKRGNRFYHYLQGTRLSNGVMRTGNILTAACKMMQEKSAPVET